MFISTINKKNKLISNSRFFYPIKNFVIVVLISRIKNMQWENFKIFKHSNLNINLKLAAI